MVWAPVLVTLVNGGGWVGPGGRGNVGKRCQIDWFVSAIGAVVLGHCSVWGMWCARGTLGVHQLPMGTPEHPHGAHRPWLPPPCCILTSCSLYTRPAPSLNISVHQLFFDLKAFFRLVYQYVGGQRGGWVGRLEVNGTGKCTGVGGSSGQR